MSSSSPARSAEIAETLDDLRARIRAIERSVSRAPPQDARSIDGASKASVWTTGAPGIDGMLGPAGLEIGAVHEVKPVSSGADWLAACAAAHSFALMLGVRRLQAEAGKTGRTHVLWCASKSMTAELGAPYGPGLAALGLDPHHLILAEPARQQDVLWTLEEGLKSDSLALAVAQLEDVALTPARRLALAAAAGRTPCLLLTHPRAAPAAATASRWRIAPAPGAPHPLDPLAPGAVRLRVALERCRGRPAPPEDLSLTLEWCDAAYRFRMASPMADRADAPGPAGARARAAAW